MRWREWYDAGFRDKCAIKINNMNDLCNPFGINPFFANGWHDKTVCDLYLNIIRRYEGTGSDVTPIIV